MATSDLIILVAYLALVIFIGNCASSAAATEEGFFLAGRKLGKLLQLFLNFGASTNSDTALSTTSAVYQQGASGAWLSFAAVFLTPYYWFMAPWFRRVRLVTMADIFDDRFGGVGLGRCYAGFQIGVAVLYIGLANLISYKIILTLVDAPISPWWFYVGYTLVVGIYITLGGLTAAAINEALQGVLIVFFSVILIPFGLRAIGGWQALSTAVPPGMLDLFGRSSQSRFTFPSVSAILFVTLVQANGGVNIITIFGSAKDEFAARLGIAGGGYAKRVMIMMWTLVGLIALALYHGPKAMADPDTIWGLMSRQLLGHGFLGLMVAGLLAGNMSLLATQAVAVSALFARNVFPRGRFAVTEADHVRLGRFAIGGVLGLGVIVAGLMDNVVSAMLLLLSVNLAFGAAILLVFIWRRLTEPAVWACVVLSTLLTIVIPFSAQCFETIRTDPRLTLTTRPTEPGLEGSAPPTPIFFERLAPRAAVAPPGGPEGHGRFNFEAWLLGRAGFEVVAFTPAQLLTTQFCFDGIFPFLVLILVSYLTPPTERRRLDIFYGKMKTPVGATSELEIHAMEETSRHPGRFEDRKLFPRSSWEFTRWTREDTLGFLGCCATSLGMFALFWLLLREAA